MVVTLQSIHVRDFTTLACIIREDSASRVNSAKQVALSPEKRGPPRAEGDRVDVTRYWLWRRIDSLSF